ncbi:MAG TPA: PilZ domain-containing protein [Polyangia bacterium]|nr:PilZ domain-containing protein [Polyangia bacterium]
MQSRRASPRIPYDEAVCLTPADASGRIYGRGLDLGTGGMSLACAQACPVGTEARCDLLLPGGPRPVTGRVVRVTPTPGGFELAIAFIDLKPGVTALIEEMVAHAAPLVLVSADEAVPVARERAGEDAIGPSGPVPKIANDPSSGDGIPKLALDGDSGDAPRENTLPYGLGPRVTPLVPTMPLPTSLPPTCGHPLPSVVVEPDLEASTETPTPTVVLPPPPPSPSSLRKTVRTAVTADFPEAPPPPGGRPSGRLAAVAPRGTGVVARRPAPPAWNWQHPGMLAAPAPVPAPPRRLSLLDAPLSIRSLMLLAPIVVLVVALVVQLSR